MAEHYTDKHQIERGSSVDIIERCIAFCRVAGDFEGILDYAEEEETPGKFQELLLQLTNEAMRIIAREAR